VTIKAGVIISDEFGQPWYVGEKDGTTDPATLLVDELIGRGYRPAPESIVLPRSLIVRSVMADPSEFEQQIRQLERGWRNTGDEDLRIEYVRAVKLFECLTVLREVKAEEVSSNA